MATSSAHALLSQLTTSTLVSANILSPPLRCSELKTLSFEQCVEFSVRKQNAARKGRECFCCVDLTADGWVERRPVVPVTVPGLPGAQQRDREPLLPAEWPRPASRQPGPSEKLVEQHAESSDDIPPEWIRRR